MIHILVDVDLSYSESMWICKDIAHFFNQQVKLKKKLINQFNFKNLQTINQQLDKNHKLAVITGRKLNFNNLPSASIDGFALGLNQNVCLLNVPKEGGLIDLLKHEIAHCYGVEHCSTPGCLMGKDVCKGKYCWKCGKCQRLSSSFCKKHNI